MTTQAVDLGRLYDILRPVAERQQRITYGQLADTYNRQWGTSYEARGTWDMPLGQLNRRLEAANLPPLSAVVVLAATNEPGGKFWESCMRLTPRPAPADQGVEYARVLAEVYGAEWPRTLPRPQATAGGDATR